MATLSDKKENKNQTVLCCLLANIFYPKQKNCNKISVASFVHACLSMPFLGSTRAWFLLFCQVKNPKQKRLNPLPFKREREREGLILHAIVIFLYTQNIWCYIFFIGLAYQGKDIVFRFTIEYRNLKGILAPR